MSEGRTGPFALQMLPAYAQAPGLWVITVYFNPCRYKTRRTNYDIFADSLRRSGIPFLTIECAFGHDKYELPESMEVIRVRSHSLFWQKERLLNLAASWLPRSATSVAWIDCDVLFMNHLWAQNMVRLLENHAIVQLFESCVRLGKGNILTRPIDKAESFGAIAPKNRETLSCGRYDAHGHTGYAWAMRRDIFDKVGLYEHAVSGSADHFMAHAIYNEYGFCVENALKHDPAQINHLKRWGERFYKLVQGRFAVVPGEIVHLWHGTLKNRDYFRRMWIITKLGFNPDTDLIDLPGKPLEWAPHVRREKPKLVAYFGEYFESRKEDEEDLEPVQRCITIPKKGAIQCNRSSKMMSWLSGVSLSGAATIFNRKPQTFRASLSR